MDKFDFDDILISPAGISHIDSRKQINIFDENGFLPLFTAPMDTVVSNTNSNIFFKNKIYHIIPRNEKSSTPDEWVAISLDDFEKLYVDGDEIPKNKILIDIANGGMNRLLTATRLSKEKYGNKLTLMVGNIANPITYKLLSDAGADYVRCGIGNGGGCWIAGTKIKTSNGYKNIEDVNTDDLVLTHTGEYKNVILTHELDYFEDLIEINGNVSTKDHKYYAIKKSDSNLVNEKNYTEYAKWIKSEDIDDTYFILELEEED